LEVACRAGATVKERGTPQVTIKETAPVRVQTTSGYGGSGRVVREWGVGETWRDLEHSTGTKKGVRLPPPLLTS